MSKMQDFDNFASKKGEKAMKKAEYDIILTYLTKVRNLTSQTMRTKNDKEYAHIKYCDKCGESGALTAFSEYNDKFSKIAVFYSCEDCHSIYQINNNEALPIRGIGLYGERPEKKGLDELFWNT